MMVSVAVGLLLPLLSVLQLSGVQGWNQHERVLLRDIQAITLYEDRYTNARRSSPIPQLKCIGGSADCSAIRPQVVQCQNRGWDGIDVQWECKVDMDNNYRFGKIEVSCEGFDYPEDPYILRGSCGLEYTLELTSEGQRRSQNGYSTGGFGGFGSGYFQKKSKDWNNDASGVLVFLFILGLGYGLYKVFLSGPSIHASAPPPPPPPGFKSDFTDNTSGYNSYGGTSAFGRQANQGPGFWTGLGTGGVLGYLFGNQRAQHHYSPYNNTWGNPAYPSPSYGNNRPFTAPSSNVRTASGFGGTKRR